MRIGVYFCLCGPNIAEKIDSEAVRQAVERLPGFGYYRTVEFLCSAVDTSAMEKDVQENRPDRVVVAACSVRDHEETFRGVLARAGMNPFLMQMVNVREHIAWVTSDREKATEKAIRHLGAAMRRVALHEPLERREIDVCTDVLVVGAGPAGLKAALNFAEAGRKVCLVEKEPVLGGLPARYEAMFPDMECGPCVLESVLGDVLHGPHAERIEILTLSSVADVVGYYGNYTVTIRQSPRYISPDLCIACGDCIPACPSVSGNPFNYGRNVKKAVDYAFQGGLPNLPFIDPESCLRTTGNGDCRLCREACPVEGAVVYEDSGKQVTRQVGAILIATGAGLYDCSRLPNLGYGRLPDVFTSLEFERILAANGPSGGAIRKADGSPPKRIAILHCVGSLDARHKEYCSGICCETAFKFNRLVAHKLPDAEVTHFYKTFSVSGKRGYKLYGEAGARASTHFVRYDDIDRLEIRSDGSSGHHVVLTAPRGGSSVTESDMVVLCPALVPSEGTARMAQMLEAATDRFGFLEELHGRMDSVRSKVRGIYMAGTCQAPMDTQKAVEQALAASGAILAGLVPGRKLVIEPVTALVDPERCSACRSCIPVCPYKAISFDSEKDSAAVNSVLCVGCGTCVSTCPSGAIKGNHFTDEQVFAEILGGVVINDRNGHPESPGRTNGSIGFEPRIVGFLCNWCSYAGADKAGTAQLQVPPNLSAIRVMCTGRVDPQFVLKAFREGADGVVILGCHLGDCHYKEQNYRALQRYRILLAMLRQLGIEEERCRLDFVSAAEGEGFARLVTGMVEAIKPLGPLDLAADRYGLDQPI